MRRLWVLFLVLAAWGAWAFAVEVDCELPLQCPETDLNFARRHYESGTNCLAQGMSREAQSHFQSAMKTASQRLRQLEQAEALLDEWKAIAETVAHAQEHFEADWTNAVREVQAIRGPLTEILGTIRRNAYDLREMRQDVQHSLQELEWLAAYAEAGNRRDAGTEMQRIQWCIERQIANQAFVDDLRRLIANTAQALAQLEEEGESSSRDDMAEQKRNHALLEHARIALFRARWNLEHGEALRARAEVEGAELNYLCKLGPNLDEATLAKRDELIRKVEELDAAAERMLAEEP